MSTVIIISDTPECGLILVLGQYFGIKLRWITYSITWAPTIHLNPLLIQFYVYNFIFITICSSIPTLLYGLDDNTYSLVQQPNITNRINYPKFCNNFAKIVNSDTSYCIWSCFFEDHLKMICNIYNHS